MDFVDGSVKDGRIVIIMRAPPPGDHLPPPPPKKADKPPPAPAKDKEVKPKDPAPAVVKKPDPPPLPKPFPSMIKNIKLSAASIEDAVEKQAAAFVSAAKAGTPFCAMCEEVKKMRALAQGGPA